MLKIIRLLGCWVIGLFVLANVSFAEDFIYYQDEIVVTALRVPHSKSTLPWQTKVISRREIERSSAIKLGDVLRSVAGVNVKANGWVNSQISIHLRGSKPEQVLVLLNGNRINSPTLGLSDLGNFLLADVERIEIVKAPLTAIYGADAVGGVINIITKKQTERHQWQVKSEYGEYATYNLAVSGSGPHYALAVEKLGSNGLSANNDTKADDVSLRLMGELGSAYVEAGMKKYSSERGLADSSSSAQSRLRDNNLFFDLMYKTDEKDLKITLSQSSLDMKYDNVSWGTTSTHKSLSTVVNLQKSFDDVNGHNLVFGLETRGDNSSSTNSGEHTQDNRAAYLQDEFKVLPNTNLIIGAREDLNSAYGDRFNPRIGSMIELLHEVALKLSWGSSFRAPTINDLYWSTSPYPTFNGGVGTTEGNVNLSPETAQSLDITLEKKFGYETFFRLTYFASTIKDLIDWADTSTSTTDEYWTPSNVADASIQGFELEGEKNISYELKGFLSLTSQTAKNLTTDKLLTYRPQLQAIVGLKYQNNTGYSSDIAIEYVGERYSDATNTKKLAAYTLVDWSLARDFGAWGLKFNIDNLFAESYQETNLYPMPGRRYNVGMSCKI